MILQILLDFIRVLNILTFVCGENDDEIDDGGASQSTNVKDIQFSLNIHYAYFMLSLKKVYQPRITSSENIGDHYQLLNYLQSENHEKNVYAILTTVNWARVPSQM